MVYIFITEINQKSTISPNLSALVGFGSKS